MSGLAGVLSAGASVFAVVAMGASLAVLLIRYFMEPFAPGLPFGPLIRRLIDGRPLTVESSGAS